MKDQAPQKHLNELESAMNCNERMETIIRYIMDRVLGKAAAQPPEAIMRHLSTCSSCREQMDILLKILTDHNFRLTKPLSCSEVNDRIPELAEMDEDMIGESFPAEWIHLQTCHECQAVYRMTRSCMDPEDETAFDRVLQSALPFPKLKPAVWEKITPHFQKLTMELNILSNKGKDAINKIPQWLGTAVLIPVPAEVYRGGDKTDGYQLMLTIPDPVRNRQIVIWTRADAPERIHLSIGLVDIEKNAGIGGVSIALLDANGRYLMQISTPDDSILEALAEFPDVAPGIYRLRITESHTSWEMPLRLS